MTSEPTPEDTTPSGVDVTIVVTMTSWKEVRFTITNRSGFSVAMTDLELGWPDKNGKLLEIKQGQTAIFTQDIDPDSVTVRLRWHV